MKKIFIVKFRSIQIDKDTNVGKLVEMEEETTHTTLTDWLFEQLYNQRTVLAISFNPKPTDEDGK